eukprot:187508-Alexandrium_andersonii.AAC.1
MAENRLVQLTEKVRRADNRMRRCIEDGSVMHSAVFLRVFRETTRAVAAMRSLRKAVVKARK